MFRNLLDYQFIRYCLVGTLNAGLSFSLFLLFYNNLPDFYKAFFSMLLAYGITSILIFYLNGKWTFTLKGDDYSIYSSYFKYIMTVMFLNLMASLTSEVVKLWISDNGIFIWLFIALPFTLFSYLLNKTFVFN